MPEITKQVLLSNVEGLTEDQAQPILDLIGNRIGEIHGQYDQDISSVTGQQKPQGTKTYVWLKDVLTGYKNQKPDESLQVKIDELTSQNTSLQQKIDQGVADQSVIDGYKQQIQDKSDQIAQLQTKLEEDKASYVKELQDTLFLNEVNQARAKLKFKSEIPESVQDTVFNSTVQKILELKRIQEDDGKGGKVTVFYNQDGSRMNNPDDKLNPYTTSDLLQKELKDIIDIGRKQAGTGTRSNDSNTNQGGSLPLDAKTQVEADIQIRNHLLQKGIATTDPKHAAEATRLRTELKVDELPIK